MVEALELYNNNVKLTTYVAKKWFASYPHLYDEILSEARIGLWKACKTFDKSQGFAFATYAIRVISNEIGCFMRRQKKYLNMVSLDSFIEGADETVTLMDSLGYEHDFDGKLNAKSIIAKLNNYPVLKRLVTGEKQKDVAKSVGLSQAQISRIYRRERKLLLAQL